ncbi:MAG: hypothetical protein JO363_03270 [Solirubrobacterales bacterium]|nr:hypothetical protein [Solirubrobacterales bacterium]
MNAWDSLLARARNRKARRCGDAPDFAPEPTPALDLVIEAIGLLRERQIDAAYHRYGEHSDIIMFSLVTAMWAEFAARSGALIDRQRADDVLALAIRAARRVVETKEG